jgi:Spy/CpxP family protein refolding chaperone
MNTTLKWKLVAGFVLAFLAGGASGGFFAASHLRQLRADFARHPHSLAERMRSRVQGELNLTPEQIEKTAPIFDQAAVELEKIRAETGKRVHQVMAEANRALAPELTDTQRAKLDALRTQPPPNRGLRSATRRRAPGSPE